MKVYLLLQEALLDCYLWSFQHKVLNNVLYFNKKVFIFRKSASPLGSFCKIVDEAIIQLFYESNITKELEKSLIFGYMF